MVRQVRQGDLLIERVQGLPPGTRPCEGQVLAYGEATDHAHRLEHGQLYLLGSDLYFRVRRPVTLRHDEHAPIQLPAGLYRVRRQREYAPAATRWVND